MDDQPAPGEKPAFVDTRTDEELGPNLRRGEDGLIYSVRTGRRVSGRVGMKWSPEYKEMMRLKREEGRRRAKEEGRMIDGSARKHFTKAEIEAANLENLADAYPSSVKFLKSIVDDETKSDKLRFDAAVKIIEYRDGRPTQKTEVDVIQRIEYVLAEWEPPRLVEAPPLIALPPPSG